MEWPHRETDRESLWLQHRDQHFSNTETSFALCAAVCSSLEYINLPDISHRLLCIPKAHPVPEALLGTAATCKNSECHFLLFVWDKALLCSPGLPWLPCVARSVLKLVTLLPQSSSAQIASKGSKLMCSVSSTFILLYQTPWSICKLDFCFVAESYYQLVSA